MNSPEVMTNMRYDGGDSDGVFEFGMMEGLQASVENTSM